MLTIPAGWRVVRLSVLLAVLGGAVPIAEAQTPDTLPRVERYRLPSAELTKRLNRRVDFAGFDDRKLTLGGALSALHQRYGLEFEVDVEAFGEAGFTGESLLEQPVARRRIPEMRNVPLAEVLGAILARVPSAAGATFVLRRDAIEITTRRRAAVQGRLGIRYLIEEYARYPVCSRETNLPVCARRLYQLLSEVGYWHGVMIRNVEELMAEARQTQAR
jgi:hypothetical protein